MAYFNFEQWCLSCFAAFFSALFNIQREANCAIKINMKLKWFLKFFQNFGIHRHGKIKFVLIDFLHYDFSSLFNSEPNFTIKECVFGIILVLNWHLSILDMIPSRQIWLKYFVDIKLNIIQTNLIAHTKSLFNWLTAWNSIYAHCYHWYLLKFKYHFSKNLFKYKLSKYNSNTAICIF